MQAVQMHTVNISNMHKGARLCAQKKFLRQDLKSLQNINLALRFVFLKIVLFLYGIRFCWSDSFTIWLLTQSAHCLMLSVLQYNIDLEHKYCFNVLILSKNVMHPAVSYNVLRGIMRI